MSQCKNTNFFSEKEFFFKKDADNSILAMVNVLKAMNLMGGILTLETKHIARMKTLEILMILLLLLFFGYTGAYSASFRSLWQVLCQIQHDVPPTPRKETC